MSISRIEPGSENTPVDFTYGLNDRALCIFVALQHVLAVLVGIVTPLMTGVIVTLIGLTLVEVGNHGPGRGGAGNAPGGARRRHGSQLVHHSGAVVQFGIGVTFVPEIFGAPPVIRDLFSSGTAQFNALCCESVMP